MTAKISIRAPWFLNDYRPRQDLQPTPDDTLLGPIRRLSTSNTNGTETTAATLRDPRLLSEVTPATTGAYDETLRAFLNKAGRWVLRELPLPANNRTFDRIGLETRLSSTMTCSAGQPRPQFGASH